MPTIRGHASHTWPALDTQRREEAAQFILDPRQDWFRAQAVRTTAKQRITFTFHGWEGRQPSPTEHITPRPLQQGVLTCSLVSWCHPRLHDSNILRSAMGFLNINSSGWSHFGSLLPENGAMSAQNTLCWVQFSLSSRSHSYSTSFSLGLVVIPNHHVRWANSAPSEYWQWENNWTSCATVSWLHSRERFIICLSENAWCRFDIWVISIRLYSSKLVCL